MAEELVDAITAADRFRRANELQQQAKAQFLAAVERERGMLNIRAISRRAGLSEYTLHHMLGRERDNNGTTPRPAA
jgi:AraC-like DNA-binding protein